jgi:hypothetical protein
VGERGDRIVVEQLAGCDQPPGDGVGDRAVQRAQLGPYVTIQLARLDLVGQRRIGRGRAVRLGVPLVLPAPVPVVGTVLASGPVVPPRSVVAPVPVETLGPGSVRTRVLFAEAVVPEPIVPVTLVPVTVVPVAIVAVTLVPVTVLAEAVRARAVVTTGTVVPGRAVIPPRTVPATRTVIPPRTVPTTRAVIPPRTVPTTPFAAAAEPLTAGLTGTG